MKNPRERAITDLHVPIGSWDIAVIFPPDKDAAIFIILSLVPIKKRSQAWRHSRTTENYGKKKV